MYVQNANIIKNAQILSHRPCGTPFLQDKWDTLQKLRSIDVRTLTEKQLIELLEQRIKHGDFKLYVQIISEGTFKFSLVHDVISSFFIDLLFLKIDKSLLSLGPRHGKSMLMCYLTTYCYALNGGFQEALYGTYGKSLTVDFGTLIRDILMKEKYLSLFPESVLHSQSRGAMAFRTKVGGRFNGVGVGTSTTGKGAGPGMKTDLFPGPLIVDDPVKDMKEALSEKAMATLHQWWSSEMSTRGNKLHFKLITATRYSLNDLHSYLLGEYNPDTLEYQNAFDEETNPDGWRYLNIPATCVNEATDPLDRDLGQAAWPDMFDEEYLRKTRLEKGNFTYSALYLGNPVPEEGSIFDESWMSWCDYEEVPELSLVYVTLDPAFGVLRDESAFTVLGVSSKTDELYILEQCANNEWEFPNLIDESERIQSLYRPKFFIVEGTASGKPLMQHFKKQGTIKMKQYPEKGTPLKDKQQKVSQVLPAFRNDQIVCVRGDWNYKLRQQVREFPFGAHDDRLDSLCIGVEYWIVNLRNKSFMENDAVAVGPSRRTDIMNLLEEEKNTLYNVNNHTDGFTSGSDTLKFDW